MELIFGIAVLFLLVLVVIWIRSTDHKLFETYKLLEKNNKTLEKILEELQSKEDYEYWLQENNETLEKILEKIARTR